jgi:hypothetical protein
MLTTSRVVVSRRSKEGSALMAVKVVHVSDISGKEAEEQSLGRLVVHEHPHYDSSDLPVTLEVLPDEVEGLKESTRFVTVEWLPPGTRRGERMTIGLDDFNLLGEAGRLDSAIDDALISKHQSRRQSSQTGGRRRSRARVDYATIEHAGKPHRGRITDAEKEIVRNNLDEVNNRLRDAGLRPIDRNDPTLKERYGL